MFASLPTPVATAVTDVLVCLRPHYPPPHCELRYTTPLQLLVAVILLPQCTAEEVNHITTTLFTTYHTPPDYLHAPRATLARQLYPLRFFRHKARYIQESCRMLEERYHGQLPRTAAELAQLPGVARKGVNLLMGALWGESVGVMVDTHVQRVANRLGLSDGRNAIKVENDLLAITPEPLWLELGYYLYQHGRYQCHTTAPACPTCPLQTLCPSCET